MCEVEIGTHGGMVEIDGDEQVGVKYEEIETGQYEEYITDDQYEEVEEQVIGMQHLEEVGSEEVILPGMPGEEILQHHTENTYDAVYPAPPSTSSVSKLGNRVSNEQLDKLLEFLSQHPNLAKGVGLGARSKEIVDKQWEILARKLNSINTGSKKSADRWKKYWADIKHKSKTRLAKRKSVLGPNNKDDLLDVDRKILKIIGEQSMFGENDYRVPFTIASIASLASLAPKPLPPVQTQTENNLKAIEKILLPVKQKIYKESVKEQICTDPIQIDSPSMNGQTCTSKVHTSELSEPGPSKGPVEETKPTGLHKNAELIKLERRRVEAESKLAEAALIMAEASRTQAESARAQAETMRTLLELIKEQHRDIRALVELAQKQASCIQNMPNKEN
ncbi:unnamed protein product [Euphydryas editha]|uniref:Regulatory protein zeste n=1 Tax=Euphydryas editha TaxID=104508 RepID=A0AAU9UUX2_EUPED|nr:unnamed protein product [Euphydryas editha]